MESAKTQGPCSDLQSQIRHGHPNSPNSRVSGRQAKSAGGKKKSAGDTYIHPNKLLLVKLQEKSSHTDSYHDHSYFWGLPLKALLNLEAPELHLTAKIWTAYCLKPLAFPTQRVRHKE